MKKQSIPRLELLGAVILARLYNAVVKALPRAVDVVHWVDSFSVLCWIQNDKPWKRYISNRVEEIRQTTNKEAWRHCPGKSNPADLPSRGIPVSELRNRPSGIWWNGPQFLQLPKSDWPKNPGLNRIHEDASTELWKNCPSVVHVLAVSAAMKSTVINLEKVFDINRYSLLCKSLY